MNGQVARQPTQDKSVVSKPPVAANETHEVVEFPGKARKPVAAKQAETIPATQVEKDSSADAIMRGFQLAAFEAQQTGASREHIARTFAELDFAIRSSDYQTVLEGGKSIADVALDVHTRLFAVLSYMAQDLVNNNKTAEAAPLQALLAKAKKNREAPKYVAEQQQQRPDPHRHEKDRQAQQQQPQM